MSHAYQPLCTASLAELLLATALRGGATAAALRGCAQIAAAVAAATLAAAAAAPASAQAAIVAVHVAVPCQISPAYLGGLAQAALALVPAPHLQPWRLPRLLSAKLLASSGSQPLPQPHRPRIPSHIPRRVQRTAPRRLPFLRSAPAMLWLQVTRPPRRAPPRAEFGAEHWSSAP